MPQKGICFINIHDNMIVIRHNGISRHVNGKDLNQRKEFILNPATTVFKVLPGEGIDTTQKCPTDTTRDTVIIRGRFQRDLRITGFWHDPILDQITFLELIKLGLKKQVVNRYYGCLIYSEKET